MLHIAQKHVTDRLFLLHLLCQVVIDMRKPVKKFAEYLQK